jgi:transcriptional regulator with XRE-family HTH domain
MKSFSDRLCAARKAAGYPSQGDFAKALNIPQQTYGNYESGRSFPKEDALLKIGVVLKVSIDSLLGVEAQCITPKKEKDLNTKINTLRHDALEASNSIEKLLESIKKLEGAL